MSDLTVIFRGLFVVVRHTAGPIPEPGAEPVTIVLPHDHRHDAADADMRGIAHQPLLFVGTRSLEASGWPPGPAGVDLPPGQAVPGYSAFDLSQWEVELPRPAGGGDDTVAHDADRAITRRDPQDGGEMDEGIFTALSALPNLNALTNAQFDQRNLDTPAPPIVNARVRLGGGRLVGLKSYKPLRHAFFDFFDHTGTVAIQPAVEDVRLDLPIGGECDIRFRRLDGSGAAAWRFRVSDEPAFLIQSFPMPMDEHAMTSDLRPTLNHFSLYYPLMTNDGSRREPLVRVLGRVEQPGRGPVLHTMPATTDVEKPLFPVPLTRTGPGTCSCLVAGAFAPLTGRSAGKLSGATTPRRPPSASAASTLSSGIPRHLRPARRRRTG